jgi:hypothetical protein
MRAIQKGGEASDEIDLGHERQVIGRRGRSGMRYDFARVKAAGK